MIKIEIKCPECHGQKSSSYNKCKICKDKGYIKQILPLSRKGLDRLFSGRVESLNRSIELRGGEELLASKKDQLVETLKLNKGLLETVYSMRKNA